MDNPRLGIAEAPPNAAAAPASVRTVPFDYVVTFPITGTAGTLHHSVINVSTVGMFVVTAIGYSLLLNRRFGPTENPEERVRGPKAPGAAPTPDFSQLRVFGNPGAKVALFINGAPVDKTELDAAGRGFSKIGFTNQALTIHDLTNQLSSPVIRILEGPRALSPQFGPTRKPFIGSHWLEILGTPERNVSLEVYDATDEDVLDPRYRGPRLRGTFPIPHEDVPEQGIEAGLLKVDIAKLGKGWAHRDDLKRLLPNDTLIVRDAGGPQNSGPLPELIATWVVSAGLDLSLADIPTDALGGGFRVNPVVLRRLRDGIPVPSDELKEPFDRCGGADDLSFLYSIIDNGAGRSYQNEPIHNVAGLGIANGDRPFRQLPRPIVLEPRSVTLFEIQEISGGPGTLYVVLQGYKVIGTGGRTL